ncbi:M23 family metallopeptidase [Clostridium thermarum]|uniref:M23 family metallopeptidase n=1 Tax=Clostridium thermarum TaxID=1716543 RepID=UPI001122FB6F|nr:M23 family metallopeptidase [Clostridium thermarum]
MNSKRGISKLAKVIVCASVVGSIGFYNLLAPNAYEVYVNGRAVACVKDMNAAETMVNKVYSELVNRFKGIKIDKDTVYLSVIANTEAMSSEEDIRNNIINALNTKVKAVEMRVDGNLVAILASKEEGQKVVSLLSTHYSNKAAQDNKKFPGISSKIEYKEIEVNLSQVDVVEDTVKKLIENTDKGTSPAVKIAYASKDGKTVSANRQKTISMAVPSRGSISSNFGLRWGRMHEGIDIAANTGDPIYAAMDGKVIYSGWASGYGKMIKIQHEDNIQTIYGHCSKLRAAVGDTVKKGQLIGDVGSTGNSTGPHLHFEVIINGKPVNPYPYIYKN